MKIIIPGVPVCKGRPKFSTHGGFPKAYTPAKTANYENLVKLAFQQSQQKPFERDAQLYAEILAVFPIPKSTSKKKHAEMLDGRIRPTKNGLAYYDDAQICSLAVVKLYGEAPRAEITIKEV